MNEQSRRDEPVRMLVVDDAEEDREAYRRFLGQCEITRYVLEEAETMAAGLKACSLFPPDCVLLDYMLPDGDGLEFLGRLADNAGRVVLPVVMLTGAGNEEVAVKAMKQGAMDYLVKDRIDKEILCRTTQTAMEKSELMRTILRQEEEKDRLIKELQDALDQVKTLKGFLPICANCKKIRNDKGYWQQVESYIQDHSEAEFSHGVCPDCLRKHYPDQAEKVLKALQENGHDPGRSGS